jgi:DNA-binding transcriptional ArsR family regulator
MSEKENALVREAEAVVRAASQEAAVSAATLDGALDRPHDRAAAADPADTHAPAPACGCAGAEAAIEGMPDEELLYDLADLFKIFGDTTRIKILYALMGRELCVADLAQAVGASQSAVSHQLRTLKQARLVRFRRDGKNVIYGLSDEHVNTMLSQGMDHICE